MLLSASVTSFKLGRKIITHEGSPATFLGENGHLNNIPIVCTELCSASLSGQGRKKKPPNFDPWGGEAEVDLHH